MFYLLKVFAIFVFFFFLVLRHAAVDGESMMPTFHDLDRVVVSNFLYQPERGDVIAFFEEDTLKKPLIKRVIGVAGDEISISDEGKVIRNGEVLEEAYAAADIDLWHRGDAAFPVTVPSGCVFVLGDNRNNSHDSRWNDISFVDIDSVIGKVLVRFYPFDRLESFL